MTTATRPTPTPYGEWPSPITAEWMTRSQIGMAEPSFAGEDLYWLESRPSEGGRVALVRCRANGTIEDVLPADMSARTRVHEMGGGAYAVRDDVIYVVEDRSQRVFVLEPGVRPRPLVPESARPRSVRYADLSVSPDGSFLVAVRETHGSGRAGVVVNDLVRIGTGGDEPQVTLVSGADFYSFPRLSPDGTRLAWTCWNHPNMPWDGCQLWVGELAGDRLVQPRRVAGGVSESIFQPEWNGSGEILFASDRTGWWNLYRESGGRVVPVAPDSAEYGLPQWVFGMSRYAVAGPDRLVAVRTADGIDRVHRIGLDPGAPTVVSKAGDPAFSGWTGVDAIASDRKGRVALIAGSANRPPSLVLCDIQTGESQIVRSSFELEIDPGYLSEPDHFEFPTTGDRNACAFFYPPVNRNHTGPTGTLPPLIVTSHGGPTGAASASLNLSIQYWTSRGFAVVDVNYGGSTGYGRAYRERLDGEWGRVDVEDCVAAARYLADTGKVDPDRMAIRGKSASGMTALAALAFHDLFRAGASYYGVADLEALARDTHKFESRYLDRLVGGYPEALERYRERSPIHHVDRLSTPIILLQGSEDTIVPPSQAEAMAEALDRKGLPYAFLRFEGEGHGFRQASSIQRALEAELYFYGKVFGFEPADTIEPVPIKNLPG